MASKAGDGEDGLLRPNRKKEGGRRRVGLIYDDRMCKHNTPDETYHEENPNRIESIWKKLRSSRITNRCVLVPAKEAEEETLALVHTRQHINFITDISSSEKYSSKQRKKKAEKFNSVYFNEGTSESASLAAGSVVEVALKVAKGELDSAFAIVRPPGHHAEKKEAMGFCIYNNIAIAASFLLDKEELNIKKILIVDWDVHHGNGTQNKFLEDSRVMYFSIHRYDNGKFFPEGNGGSYDQIGKGPGTGYNINVPWDKGGYGDPDYMAVFDHLLIPVTKAFQPDLIMISAGFDAAFGDPLGGCCVTPRGYGRMLSKLMEFAGGKIVMALEGGYDPDAIAKSVYACVKVLLYNKPPSEKLDRHDRLPYPETWDVIRNVRFKLRRLWTTLAEELPDVTRVTPTEELSEVTRVTSERSQRGRLLRSRPSDPIPASQSSSRPRALQTSNHFHKGDIVWAYYEQRLYQAKVIKARRRKKRYLVHYKNSSSRWDEWVREERLLKTNPLHDMLASKLVKKPSIIVKESKWRVSRPKCPGPRALFKKELNAFRKEFNVKMPRRLHKELILDYDYSLHLGKIVIIPRRRLCTVGRILRAYSDSLAARNPPRVSTLQPLLINLFNEYLPKKLLYKTEIKDLDDRTRARPDEVPVDLYGAEHLLRLLVYLGNLTPKERADLPEIADVPRAELKGLLRFLARNSRTYFIPEYRWRVREVAIEDGGAELAFDGLA